MYQGTHIVCTEQEEKEDDIQTQAFWSKLPSDRTRLPKSAIFRASDSVLLEVDFNGWRDYLKPSWSRDQ